jgi:hypothetical protein
VIVGIMDGEIVTGAEVELQAALDLLRVGDVGYELFRSDASAQITDVTIPTFNMVRYIDPDPEDPLMYDAQNIVLKIQAAYNLAPRHNVGVIGMTVPEAIGDRGGIPLVPFSDSLSVQAVVSNSGNEEEPAVGVDLVVLNVDTGESIADEQTIDALEGGASTTVTFADLQIVPGGLYQVTVTVTIPLDNDPDNDSWSWTFIWNEES